MSGRLLRRMYGLLLRLYPAGYRRRFAAEMTAVFEEAAAEANRRWRFALAEMLGLVRGAGREWISRFHGVRRDVQDVDDGAGDAADVPDEVLEARVRVLLNLRRMEHAIANHDFSNARLYSELDHRERKRLRWLEEKYGAGEM